MAEATVEEAAQYLHSLEASALLILAREDGEESQELSAAYEALHWDARVVNSSWIPREAAIVAYDRGLMSATEMDFLLQ